jgi:hypothetical protein
MGGKGASPSNNQMVEFEKQQAAEARQKEEERKGRLELGVKNISKVFHGAEKTAPQTVKFDPASLAGFQPTANGAAIGGTPDAAGYTRGAFADIGDSGLRYKPVGGTQSGYEAYDPDGNLLEGEGQWSDLMAGLTGKQYTKQVGTGEYENDPFGASFTDPYKKAYIDYQKGDLDKQYNKQLDEALYGFARSGTRGGSAYADTLADIGGIKDDTPYGEYGKNLVGIRSGGDKAVTDLKNMIASQEQQATNQLYQTEDPEKAANAARQLAGNIPATPNLSPLGDFFKPLVIGASNVYGGYTGQADFNRMFSSKSPLDTTGSGKNNAG